MKWNKVVFAATTLALACLLSGCFVKTVDELYALPRHTDAYYDLQDAIDLVMAGGAEYCAPVSGNNQQSVQLADLDGDGSDEAIVFLKSGGDKPLNAYIFDQVDGEYKNIAVIEGNGSAFESAEYLQLDDEAGLEIIIGRQLSDQVLQAMSAYKLSDGHIVELMSANYSEYTTVDLDGDGRRDIFALRFDAEERQGVVELYRYNNGQMAREAEASMSVGVETIKRMVTGYMTTGVPAVFVASVYNEDSIVTDIFAFRGGTFQNVSSSSDTGLSVQTVRNYFVYATDIDSDGLIELPELEQLPAATSGGVGYSLIHWYNLGLDGKKTVKLTTYHNYSSGWYVSLLEPWSGKLTITQSDEVSGVRGTSFYEYKTGGQTGKLLFTIYAFSGEDRNSVAAQEGRFILAEKGDVTYAAQLGESKLVSGLLQDDLKRMFSFIHIDWNSGET